MMICDSIAFPSGNTALHGSPHSLFYFSFLPGACYIFKGNNTAGSCPWGVTGDVSYLCERIKVPLCLVYQKVFAKEQMCISLRTVAWEPRIPFSELPLESLMLLHLLLRDFIDCVAELHGQQGVAVGDGCVRVQREVSFVFVEKQ